MQLALPTSSFKLSYDHGVTMVEFAIVSLLFVVIIGAIIDASLYFWTYHRVGQATTIAAREATLADADCKIKPEDASSSLKRIEISAINHAKEVATSRFGLTNFEAYAKTTSSPTSTPTNQQLMLTLTGRTDLKCVICALLPNGINITAKASSLYIKDPCS